MKYGYIRVSTDEQETKRQENIMDDFKVDKVIIEKESGKNLDDRPKLNALLELMEEGDVLCVESFSRLSRNLFDFLTVTKMLKEKGIELKSKKENFDTSGPYGQFACNVFASLYQMEREMLKDRQAEGIAAAKQLGIKFGRPEVQYDQDKFAEMVEKNIHNEIRGEQAAAELGISLSTYNRRKKKYLEAKRMVEREDD